MKQRIGYARVSTEDQHLNLQRDSLRQAGWHVIYKEVGSGKNAARLPNLTQIAANCSVRESASGASLRRSKRTAQRQLGRPRLHGPCRARVRWIREQANAARARGVQAAASPSLGRSRCARSRRSCVTRKSKLLTCPTLRHFPYSALQALFALLPRGTHNHRCT
jgi:hypothetical protein